MIAYEVQCRFCDAVSIRRAVGSCDLRRVFDGAGPGKIFGLDQEKLRRCVNIGGVASAALRQSRVGELSHWKGCAFANAAAKRLCGHARPRGITGPAPIFEGEKGFEKLVAGEPMHVPYPFGGDKPMPQASADDFMIRQSCIKYYPAEYHAQSAVYVALQLKKKLGIKDGTDIDSVLIESTTPRWISSAASRKVASRFPRNRRPFAAVHGGRGAGGWRTDRQAVRTVAIQR